MNNNSYIERQEIGILKERIREYFNNPDAGTKLQVVLGLAGVGKSVMLQHLVDELSKEEEYQNRFLCRVDISDCADEIEIYLRIAVQLREYYTTAGGESRQKKALDRFMKLHEWIYGASIYNTGINLQKKTLEIIDETVINDCIKKIKDKINKSDLKGTEDNKYQLFLEVVEPVMDKIPFIHFGKVLVEIAVDSYEKYKKKQLLEESLEAINNKVERKNVFRNNLIDAMPTGDKNDGHLAIILDNFQLNSNEELGRDHTWLIQSGGLIDSIKAYWIIAGRSAGLVDIFNPEQWNVEELIQLQGFSIEQAIAYINKRTELYFDEKQADLELKDSIINRILDICKEAGHDYVMNTETTEEKLYYPPYLLSLVVNHFCKLCSDPAYNITVDSLVGLGSKEEFIGYYFYKDLSDLMTNAFQIVSCLAVWDEKWIEIVRERFDNHLLNAETVLFKLAPMERVGIHQFKLHEGTREGLFNVSTNYIKYDVLKFLYERFIEVYEYDEAKENKEFWYESDRLQTFADCAYQYIRLMREKSKYYVTGLQRAMEKIYKENSLRGTVTDSFIQFYSRYIDLYGKTFGIPFVTLENQDLSDENIENLENMLKENIEKDSGCIKSNIIDGFVYFMECCFKLSDMYTHINCSSAAYNLEKLGIIFWENIIALIPEEERNAEYWKCNQQLLKQVNAYAFDNSQEHNYKVAYDYCKKGLKLAYFMTENILNNFKSLCKEEKMSNVDVEILRIFINPEKLDRFAIGSYKEIDQNVFNQLKDAYCLLIDWNESSRKRKKEGDKTLYIQDVLSEMLLVEYLKLRGNYPWYNFNTNDHEFDGVQSVEFGVRTYWMRRAILEVLEENKAPLNDKKIARSNMIRSYHNVCVYLYKKGDIQDACILEHEVVEEAEMVLSGAPIEGKAQYRIKDITDNLSIMKGVSVDSVSGESHFYILFMYLWEDVIKNLEGMELLKKHPLILECMQYMGDYYLHMKYYTLAYIKLSQVTLYRYVKYGVEDNKTLDSLLRLYVVAVLNNKKECQKLIEKCVKYKLPEKFDKKNWSEIKKGLGEKIQSINQMIQIVENGGDSLENKLFEELDK